jgi:hypothetical protein
MKTWIPLLVAGLTGLLGLIGVILGTTAQYRITVESARRGADLERLRRLLDEENRQQLSVNRYQEPLVRAAYDLQSRLWNILRKAMLEDFPSVESSREWLYARDSTAWLFGQYFGWLEILRREAQFLVLPAPDARRSLQSALNTIAHICSSDHEITDPTFQIFRSEQRALGECMIVDGTDAEGRPRTSSMGYAFFVTELRRTDSDVAHWFAKLQADVAAAAESDRGRERLRRLQHALIDLIDLIDPHPFVRFPKDRQPV